MSMESFIHHLPKCELHLHLEGTLEPNLRIALAARNGMKLPFADEAQMKAAYACSDLPSFLVNYCAGLEVLLKEPDFYDLAFAYLKKARSQNVFYAEMFFDPQAHTSRGITFDTLIQGLHRAQVDAEQQLGIQSQLIMCFRRDWSAEYAMSTLMESLPYKNWIIGVGLDYDEKGHPPRKFTSVFHRARDEGYMLTMHCDVNQDNSVAHIWECIDLLGASRIDHGVNALEDPALCKVLADRQLALTVCPISNAFVTDSSQTQAIRKMLDLGLRVTVNSDDPGYFQAYMEENFALVQRELDLSTSALAVLSRNAFEAAWIPRPAKDQYLMLLDKHVKTFKAA